MSELQLTDIFKIETLYEEGLSKLGDLSVCPYPHYLDALMELEIRNFEKFYQKMLLLLESAVSTQEKAFVVSWLIIATEVQFDNSKRKVYLNILDNIRKCEMNLYVEFLIFYFEGITYFYEGDHDLSEMRTQKALAAAKLINYNRGQARCYYQLGLIFNETNRLLEAKQTLKVCLDLCLKNHLFKTEKRALLAFEDRNGHVDCQDNLESMIEKIKQSLKQNDLIYARMLIAKADCIRRTKKIGKEKYSLYFYRIQYLLKKQKISYARRLMAHLKDPILIQKAITLMSELQITLSFSEKERLKQLNYSLFGIVGSISTKRIQVSKIKIDLVRKLFFILGQKQNFPKDALFELLYGIPYDPTIHDVKLYKLISIAKKETFPNVIINKYGSYSLNQENYSWNFTD